MPFTNSGVSPVFESGSQLANYQIAEEIGRGAAAVVYRARDVWLDRWVALKILSNDVTRNRAYRQRFVQESKAAAAVDHPNILPIFDADEADGVFYIAMRYVSDRDLGSLIDRIGPLPLARAVSITAQIASALDAAHARGLVHRDVKPANILLGDVTENDTGDHVYLSDFGISMPAGLPAAEEGLGMVNYAAPEQILGVAMDGRADAYSLACVFFEMLSGRPPFTGEYDELGQLAQFSATPPSLTATRRDLPPAIDQVLARALSVAPEDRYGSCRALAAALAEACGLAAGQPPDESAAPASAPVPGRRRLAIALACAAVLAVAGGTWSLLHGTTSPRPVQAADKPIIGVTVPTTIRAKAPTASHASSPAATRSAAASPRATASHHVATAPHATASPAASGAASSSPPAASRAANCPKAATAYISADCYTASRGTTRVIPTGDPSPAGIDGNQVAELSNGRYLEYPDVNFGSGSNHFTARVSCGAPSYASGGVEVVLDNPANKPVAGFSLASTGGWNSWVTTGSTMTEVTGVHNVYIVLASGGPIPYLSLHYFTFAQR